jgi:hypothetical protein
MWNVSSWCVLSNYAMMHGQQNIKFIAPYYCTYTPQRQATFSNHNLTDHKPGQG